jgi:hypothetical protein
VAIMQSIAFVWVSELFATLKYRFDVCVITVRKIASRPKMSFKIYKLSCSLKFQHKK